MTEEDDVPPDEDLHFQPPTEEVFVPGLAATTVKVQSLLNSLPSWTLRAGGALQGFLLSMLSVPRRLISARTSTRGAV